MRLGKASTGCLLQYFLPAHGKQTLSSESPIVQEEIAPTTASMSSFALGIVAALSAPLTMTVGFIVWDNHWAGSAFALNMFKCTLASVGFVILSATTRDEPFSSDLFQFKPVGYLMLSSVIGIVVGDWTWLEGLRLLGPRRVIVMDSLKPFLAAVFGWLLLGEELRLGALGGIVLTVVGIVLVSLESSSGSSGDDADRGNAEKEEEIIRADGKETVYHSKDKEAEENVISDKNNTTDGATISLGTGSFPVESHTAADDMLAGNESTQDSSNNVGSEITLTQHEQISNGETIPVENDDFTPVAPPLPTAIPPPSPSTSTNSSKRASTLLETQRGFFMAILNVVLDTYGSVLTKEHGSNFSTWEINLVRFGFAAAVMMVASTMLQVRDYLLGQTHKEAIEKSTNHTAVPASIDRDVEEAKSEGIATATDADDTKATATTDDVQSWYKLPLSSMTRSAWWHVCLGVLFVTFVTPALSNYALFQIALALALTLGSVGPLYALPLTYIMRKDDETKKPTARACLGAAFTVAGIVVLAFWGTLE